MSDKDRSFVLRTAVVVLAISALGMVFTLLAGLFEPAVDNETIFGILGPMSQNITGALISILSGLIAVKINRPEPADPAARGE